MVMRSVKRGSFSYLTNRFGNKFFAGRITAALLGFCLLVVAGQASAVAGSRTLSFYFGHTKESISVTYKRNGSYDKKGLKKLNWFFRDWRRNASTRMDPAVFDLIWELKTELGAKKPIYVVSGFRSARTNKKLRRMGRKVARRSQHIRGKAIDLYFPGVRLSKLRNAALVRERGGVGYYPRSGSHGFVHVDTASVRHWPRMSRSKLAAIFRKHKSRRRATPAPVYIAKAKSKSATSSKVAVTKRLTKPSVKKPAVYAALSNKARAALRAQVEKSNVPVPRPKPYTVMAALQGQNDITIQPASAPVQVTNFASKRNPDDAMRVDKLDNQQLIFVQPHAELQTAGMFTSPVTSNPLPGFWKASRKLSSFTTSNVRHDGQPQQFKRDLAYSGPLVLGSAGVKVANASGDVPAAIVRANRATTRQANTARIFTLEEQARISAQVVNRNGKTSLARTPAVRMMRPKLAPLNKQARLEQKRLETMATEGKPLVFE
jgi:uncharacterized protein YcbK (DUF882 family)